MPTALNRTSKNAVIPGPFCDASRCNACEVLLNKVNEAKMHALLAAAWAKLRENQGRAMLQTKMADAQLEMAFRELESHWREAHGMNC